MNHDASGVEAGLAALAAQASAGVPPLEGVRVLDFTHYRAGPRCTKLLADFGADVIKIERPPAGDPARQIGPFYKDTPNPEASGTFLFLNTNKRSVTLNLASPLGCDYALALVEKADIVVESFRPGVVRRLGLDFATLNARRPGLVMTSISNFGQTGPYRDLPASEITLSAMGGPMNVTGHREREPLKLAGNIVQYHAGSVAAFATVTALYGVEAAAEAGEAPNGEYIDVSIYETQTSFRDRRTIYLTAFAYTGDVGQRPIPGTRPGAGVRPCADGYVNITVAGARRFPVFMRMIGREDLAARVNGLTPLTVAMEPDLAHEVEEAYLAWLMRHGKHEAAAIAQQNRILAAPVNTVRDLLEDESFRARGAFETIDHPATGTVRYAGRPFVMGDSPRPPAHRAPLLGEHTAEVLCGELGVDAADLPRLRELGIL